MRYLLFLLLLLLVLCLPAQELYFPAATNDDWATLSLEEAGLCAGNEQALYDYLEATNTDAFLLLKDGKIVLERYFGNFTVNTPHLWNSAGKSLMAMAVGIAAELDSLDLQDRTADYLGAGWTNCPETEDGIRVVHQLTMTSGLSDQTGDVFCTAPECLVCLADPGTRWAYHNGPYTLLGEVVEAATGQDLNDFITERIKRPTGMTGQYRYIGDNRIFISNARSMARYGLLMLGGGVWDGTPVLGDTAYYRAMINSSQELNPAYGYLWWLNGKASYKLPSLQINFPGSIAPHAPADMYAAIGKNGQIINVVPATGIVVVRMGGNPGGDVLVPSSYNDSLWVRINALSCTTATEERPGTAGADLQVAPNPVTTAVTITTTSTLRRVTVFTGAGRRLLTRSLTGREATLALDGLPAGVLYLRVEHQNGGVVWRRLVRR